MANSAVGALTSEHDMSSNNTMLIRLKSVVPDITEAPDTFPLIRRRVTDVSQRNIP